MNSNIDSNNSDKYNNSDSSSSRGLGARHSLAQSKLPA